MDKWFGYVYLDSVDISTCMCISTHDLCMLQSAVSGEERYIRLLRPPRNGRQMPGHSHTQFDANPSPSHNHTSPILINKFSS